MAKDPFSGCHSLPVGSCLHGTYQIQEVIGAGGFAVTYRGIRNDTGEIVAIKEYFPPSLAVRSRQEGLYALRPFPERNTAAFQKGLRRFLNEANLLKSFHELESVVVAYDLFEENGTAYLVMEYIEGLTLSRYVAENGVFTFPEISELIAPVVCSLSKIHGWGLVHRDISPDNLILGTDNKLHLIDFGAAGRESAGGGQNTVIVKPGYAPPEQYTTGGKLGAWVDIYAVCATIYFSLTGSAPVEAIYRQQSDERPQPAVLNRLLPWQSAVLEKGLQLRPAERFQNAGELYAALTGTAGEEENATVIRAGMAEGRWVRLRKRYRFRRNMVWRMFFAAAAVSALAVPAAVLSRTPALSRVPAGQSFVSREQLLYTQLRRTVSPMALSPFSEREASTAKPEMPVMPDVTGLTVKKAKRKLREKNPDIRINLTDSYHSTVAAGRVISQSVAKDAASVSLTVSKGKRPSVASSPKPREKTTTSPDYKVKGDDDLVSIPLN